MESYNKQINFIIVYYYSFSSVNIVWIIQTFLRGSLKIILRLYYSLNDLSEILTETGGFGKKERQAQHFKVHITVHGCCW